MQHKYLTPANSDQSSLAARRWVMPVLCSLVLPLTACGNDDVDASAASVSSEAGSAAQAETEVQAKTATQAETAVQTPDSTEAQEVVEITLPPIAEEHLALLSTEPTTHAFGQTLPRHVWMDLSGVITHPMEYIEELEEERPALQIAKPGGAPYEPEAHVFKPADDTGRFDYIRQGGTNDHGPYKLVIRESVMHENQGDTPLLTEFHINLPAGAQSGQSYSVKGQKQASEEEVQAYVTPGRSSGLRMNEEAVGVIDLIEIGETLSAAWDIQLDNADGGTLHFVGAARDIPLQPRLELRAEIKQENREAESFNHPAKYEMSELFIPEEKRVVRTLRVVDQNNAVAVNLPLDITPGNYTAGAIADGDIGFGAGLMESPELQANITVVENGDQYYDIQFDYKSDDNTWGKGAFEFLPKNLLEK